MNALLRGGLVRVGRAPYDPVLASEGLGVPIKTVSMESADELATIVRDRVPAQSLPPLRTLHQLDHQSKAHPGHRALVADGKRERLPRLLLLLLEQRQLLRGQLQPLPRLDLLHLIAIDEGQEGFLEGGPDRLVFALAVRRALFRQLALVDELFEQLGMIAPMGDAERIVVALQAI